MANALDELVIEISISPTEPPMLIATVCYSGDESTSQAVLAPVRKFGPPVFDGLHHTRLSQLTTITDELTKFIEANSISVTSNPKEGDGNYNHWRGATISEWTDPAINTFVTCIDSAPVGWSTGVGHYMHGAPCAVSDQESPILRDKHTSSYFFSMSWSHSSQSEDSMTWVDQLVAKMKPFNHTGTYINYLSTNDASAVADAYGANYSRLRNLKSQYDPENSLHLNRNIRA